MASERGIVVRTGAGTAWIKVVPSEACQGCSAHGSCAAQRGEMEVEVLDPVGAEVGDRIVVDMETASLLKASFLLYVVPIVSLTAGASFGFTAAGWWAGDPSMFSAVFGLAGFGLSLLFIKNRGNRMAGSRAYRPKIVKILR